MATYIYETIPAKSGVEPKRFEIRQSMNDDALDVHPETGEPVRRVITGGYGYLKNERPVAAPRATGGHSCGGGCSCG